MGCPPVRKIIHSLKLMDYLHVQADNPWYNYYFFDEVLFLYGEHLLSGMPNKIILFYSILRKVICRLMIFHGEIS